MPVKLERVAVHVHRTRIVVARRMTGALDAMGTAPFTDAGGIPFGQQLGAEAEQRDARSRCLRSDVAPERRIQQHRADAELLLEFFVEPWCPRPCLRVEAHIIKKIALDGRA